MTQLSFADIQIARNKDPESPHAAAKRVTESGRRASQLNAVLEAVQRHPGRTSLELSAYCLDRYVLARRLPELAKLGKVKRGEIRTCAVGNRPALTWLAR